MYESIRGKLLRREPALAVVEAAGLAYRIQVPLSTFERLPEAGHEVTLKLHLAVREDEWRLFGFERDSERAMFLALLRVNGVGPVMALSLLSGFQPAEFQSAVAAGDIRALTRVKGVGRKTAERIVVELRDHFGALAPGAVEPPDGQAAGPAEDAIRGLVSLGLDPVEARRRVAAHAAAASTPPDAAAPIRLALRG
ncbi:MAG: Holliday junction branch migration protein RuvA, partial [Planctomycetota bacterium]|nr:Holliday junction branch migration protein RuvA [Planctomycetota bacterium]